MLTTAAAPAGSAIDFDHFRSVDISVGTVVGVDPFPEARNPSWKRRIDFGPGIGIKKSSAQITQHYSADHLIGRQVAAVVNFPPRQIGPFMSEVLKIGGAHVCTPVTNAHLVCRLLLDTNNNPRRPPPYHTHQLRNRTSRNSTP